MALDGETEEWGVLGFPVPSLPGWITRKLNRPPRWIVFLNFPNNFIEIKTPGRIVPAKIKLGTDTITGEK